MQIRRLGKCDACRQRKVKCDEQKPICSSCEKGSRTCKYSYAQGQGFTLVMQDPSQMTRYGRSIAAPLIYPLTSVPETSQSSTPESTSIPSPESTPILEAKLNGLHLRDGLAAANGEGFFQTLAPAKSKPKRVSKKFEISQKRKFQEHLIRLQRESALVSYQPSSSESRVSAMLVDMMDPNSPQHGSMFSLGDWVTSIPSRMNSSPAVSIAAEFFIHSFKFHRDQSHTNQTTALQTKSKALKQLQLAMLNSQQNPDYNLVVATKLHYAAEVLIGVGNMSYAIHTLGLLDLTKAGVISGVDGQLFWSIIDSTYIDDITMSMMAGRISLYDNEFYLCATHPATLSVQSLPEKQQVTMAMMHILIQCPRLILAIRHAIRLSDIPEAVASAVTLAESLWYLMRQANLTDFMTRSTFITDDPVDEAVAHILNFGQTFETAQDMVICTRYWLLQALLCGCIDTLQRRLPQHYAASHLPEPDLLHSVDTDASVQLGRVIVGMGDNPSPLTLLRTHGPLSVSVGSWHRQARYLNSCDSTTTTIRAVGHASAEAMMKWLIEKCNIVLKRLQVSQAEIETWLEALDCMAGEEPADWMPNNVSFGSEDGEMVMRLEYSNQVTDGDARTDRGVRVFSVRNPSSFGPQDLRAWMKGQRSVVPQ